MKKYNVLFVALLLIFSFLCSTKVFSLNENIITMDNKEFLDFENYLKSAAIIYGVHSQLTKQEGIHIPQLDAIVSEIKDTLSKMGMNFSELAGSPDFVRTAGHARICSYFFYPELESIFKVRLPRPKKLGLDNYCKGLSLAQALETVKKYN